MRAPRVSCVNTPIAKDRVLPDRASQGSCKLVPGARGPPPQSRAATRKTCLMGALLRVSGDRGSVGATRGLLAAGADRNARNIYGATALDIAMREGRDDAADALRNA